MKMLKPLFWKWLHPRWKTPLKPLIEGYTVLMPVPGDLPSFLKVAVECVKHQNLEDLVEILVIPDKPTPEIMQTFKDAEKNWPEGKLRLVTLPYLDQWIGDYTNNPHHLYWFQLVAGVNAATSTHALLHDADLFLSDPAFFQRVQKRCRSENLSFVGVSPPWDGWFKQKGFNHMAATWEMFFSLDWFRKFPPWQHHGQTVNVKGENHVFDATFWPQMLTPPSEGGFVPLNKDFVHFNYVIGTFRRFQKTGELDDGYKIFLVKCIQDVFGIKADNLPAYEILYKHYDRKKFPEFRDKFEELMKIPFLTKSQTDQMRQKIAPFYESDDR